MARASGITTIRAGSRQQARRLLGGIVNSAATEDEDAGPKLRRPLLHHPLTTGAKWITSESLAWRRRSEGTTRGGIGSRQRGGSGNLNEAEPYLMPPPRSSSCSSLQAGRWLQRSLRPATYDDAGGGGCGRSAVVVRRERPRTYHRGRRVGDAETLGAAAGSSMVRGCGVLTIGLGLGLPTSSMAIPRDQQQKPAAVASSPPYTLLRS